MIALKYKQIGIWVALSIVIASCQRDPDVPAIEYAPDMYYAVPYEPLKQNIDFDNPVNPQGMNMRYPVKGTISRRNYHTTFGKGDSARTDLMIYRIHKDSIGIAERTLINPVPLNEKTLEEGKVLYTNFCQHCHGEKGDGQGPVGVVYKGVPSYTSAALRDMNDGHVYHVITHGKGRMWPHASLVNPEERWKIVHYVHTLQKQ